MEASANTLTEAKKKDGWILLFDGKTTEHFKGFKSDAVPPTWEVADGALHAKGGGGDLVTKDQYKDFEFACSGRSPRAATAASSTAPPTRAAPPTRPGPSTRSWTTRATSTRNR